MTCRDAGCSISVCNTGWWLLSAIQAGAEYVHGVDGREMHVEQSNLVFSQFEIDPVRYQFETPNVFNLDDLCEFDIVQGPGAALPRRQAVRAN